MNDFTKEELEIIRDGLLWRDIKTLPTDRPFDLQFKVKRMIANYCEHEPESCCDCSIIKIVDLLLSDVGTISSLHHIILRDLNLDDLYIVLDIIAKQRCEILSKVFGRYFYKKKLKKINDALDIIDDHKYNILKGLKEISK